MKRMRMKDILILEEAGVDWQRVEVVRKNHEYIRVRNEFGREFDVRY